MPWYPCPSCCRRKQVDPYCYICSPGTGPAPRWFVEIFNVGNAVGGTCTLCALQVDDVWLLDQAGRCRWTVTDTLSDPGCGLSQIDIELEFLPSEVGGDGRIRCYITLYNGAEFEVHEFGLDPVPEQDCNILLEQLNYIGTDLTNITTPLCDLSGARVDVFPDIL